MALDLTSHPWLVDTHCHLHFPKSYPDVVEVYARMRSKNLWGITVGTMLDNSAKAIAYAEAHEGIWASVGLHPEHLSSSYHDPDEGDVVETTVDSEALRTLAQSSKKVVAIGETGLDLYRVDEGRAPADAQRAQEEAFVIHLDIAAELGLPVIIHCREALGRLAEILEARFAQGCIFSGVVHSFTGTWEEAERLLACGCYIALNGIATFPPKKTADPMRSLDRTIVAIPLDRLLLETDAPFLAPIPHRGQRNEPAHIEHIARYIAEKRGISFDEMARMTTENALRLFKLDTK